MLQYGPENGEKRAPVDATLTATVASDIFNHEEPEEDMEEPPLSRDPEESWGVVDEVIYGDLEKGEIWLELDEWLKRESATEDGRRLRLGAVCIGSGGHHTQEVYRFCNTRFARHIYAIKGMDDGRPIWPRRAGKSR